MAYTYPQQNSKTEEYVAGGAVILGLILIFTGPQSLGMGLLLSAFPLATAIESYMITEGADYIVTHYKGEDALKEAIKLAKYAKDQSLKYWLIGGVFFIIALVGGLLAIAPVALANLANFIMIFVARSKYKELKKLYLISQLQKNGNQAAVLVDI